MPISKNIEPLLWRLEASGNADERAQIVAKLATGEMDGRSLPHWSRLATDRDENVRNRALDFLARKASSPPVELFVQQLPNAGYATQQVLIESLTRAASAAGPEFVEQLLPLTAAGEPSTRSAVMKILIGLGQPKVVIRQYIQFTKTLAPFVRERALDGLRAFGNDLIELCLNEFRCLPPKAHDRVQRRLPAPRSHPEGAGRGRPGMADGVGPPPRRLPGGGHGPPSRGVDFGDLPERLH